MLLGFVLVFFNEVNVSFRLTMGTIVLNGDNYFAFVKTPSCCSEKGFGDHGLEGCGDERNHAFTTRIPKCNGQMFRGRVRWPLSPSQ